MTSWISYKKHEFNCFSECLGVCVCLGMCEFLDVNNFETIFSERPDAYKNHSTIFRFALRNEQ